MTINLSDQLEEQLRHLAGQEGRPLELVVEDAIRSYLDAASIRDLEPDEVAATQMHLTPELKNTPPWSDPQEPSNHTW